MVAALKAAAPRLGAGWRLAVGLAGLAVGLAVLPGHVAWAQTDTANARAFALNQPSHLTPRALTGLLTAVTRAGDRLVAVGERGRILLSDDNGKSWRQVATPTSVTLAKVAFITPQDGWAVGGMGVVLHSGDGGLSWQLQFDGIRAASAALADAQAMVKQAGTNDTTTANLQAAQQMVGAGPSVPFLALLPQSQNDVIIAGAFGMAFSSADGGASWHSLANILPNPDGLHIYGMLQQNDTLFVVGEQGLVLLGPPSAPLKALTAPFQGTFFGELFTADAWVIYGLQGTILRSTDQGAHWTASSTTASVGIDCGIMLKDKDVVLGDVAGELLRSHDDGQSFSSITVGGPVVGLTQAADGAVIAVGPAGPQRIGLAQLGAGA